MSTIIFMIIVGVLSTIFAKAKGNKEPSKSKSFSFNRFDDFRELFNNKTTNHLPKETSPKPSMKPEFQPGNLESIEKKYLQIKHIPEASPRPELKQTEQVKMTEKDRKEEGKEQFSESPDAKALVNGIIWAEILGEPRAKKPYFMRKN